MAELTAPVFRAASTNVDTGGAATSLALTNPTGLTDGDGQYIWIGAFTIAGGVPVLTAPSGWTAAGPARTFTAWSAGNIDGVVQLYQRIASSDGTATVTSDRAAIWGGARLAYSNADAANWHPSNFDEVYGATASGTSHAATGITTAKDGQLCTWLFLGSTGSTWTPPGTITERVDLASGVSFTVGDSIEATAGATGSRTFTSSVTLEGQFGIGIFQGPPIIQGHPSNRFGADGSTVTFTVTAPTATGYQWQRQGPLGGSWASVSGGSGGTTASYTTPTLVRATDAGAQYRCVVTAPDGTVTSNQASLWVSQIPTSYSASVGLVVGSSLSWVGHSYVGAADSSGSSVALTGNAATGALGAFGVTASVALSGNVGTGGVGSLSPSAAISVALTGNAATGAVGSFGVALSNALSGLAGTTAVGTLAASASVALVGNVATGSVGTLTPTLAVIQALTGVNATGGVGTLGVTVTTALSGNAASGALGSLGVAIPIGGNAATGAAGSLGAAASVAITGNAGTGAVGTLTPVTAATAALTGVNATGAVGSFGVTLTTALSGNAATGSSGTLGAAAARALSGNAATGGVGSVAAAASAGLAGNAASGAVGNLGPSVAGSVQLTGNAATGAVGSVGASVTVALGGVAATGAVGSVAASFAYVAALSGNAATGSVGTLGASLSTSISGQAAVGGVGSVAAAAIAALSGNGAAGSVGSFQAFLEATLSGVVGTGGVGNLTPSVNGSIILALSGVAASGAVGTLAIGQVYGNSAPPLVPRNQSGVERETVTQGRTREPALQGIGRGSVKQRTRR